MTTTLLIPATYKTLQLVQHVVNKFLTALYQILMLQISLAVLNVIEAPNETATTHKRFMKHAFMKIHVLTIYTAIKYVSYSKFYKKEIIKEVPY